MARKERYSYPLLRKQIRTLPSYTDDISLFASVASVASVALSVRQWRWFSKGNES